MRENTLTRRQITVLPIYIILLGIVSFISSCKTQRQVQYFQGAIDTAQLSRVNIPEPVIQKGDILGITVYSDNFSESAIFNQGGGGLTSSQTNSSGFNALSGSSNQNAPSYLVDLDGNIHIHSIGIIKTEGLTKKQLTQLLQEKLSAYLKNPYCTIRFLNYKFTVLGEVTKQGVFSIPGDNITIMEALGMAGDMTMYGLKDSVFVMREYDGQRTFGYLNVSDPNVVLSPYYYLKQNDVILVRADAKKPTASEQSTTRKLAIVAAIATVLTSLSVIAFNIMR